MLWGIHGMKSWRLAHRRVILSHATSISPDLAEMARWRKVKTMRLRGWVLHPLLRSESAPLGSRKMCDPLPQPFEIILLIEGHRYPWFQNLAVGIGVDIALEDP